MDHKLQEITEKLYQEGVIKGQEEAKRIISEANEQAKSIVDNAQKEALSILSEAKKKAIDIDNNVRSELQVATRQIISSLEHEVSNLVTVNLAEEVVSLVVDDKDFMQQLVLSMAEKWAGGSNTVVFVNPGESDVINKFFALKAKHILDQGLSIEAANHIKAGFQIAPADGSYKVSFTREDFVNFFKEFIRPKISDLLFAQK